MGSRNEANPQFVSGHLPGLPTNSTVIRGTRITVQTVLAFLAAGDFVGDVLGEYPTLKREDVQACLDYASKLTANRYSVMPVT